MKPADHPIPQAGGLPHGSRLRVSRGKDMLRLRWRVVSSVRAASARAITAVWAAIALAALTGMLRSALAGSDTALGDLIRLGLIFAFSASFAGISYRRHPGLFEELTFTGEGFLHKPGWSRGHDTDSPVEPDEVLRVEVQGRGSFMTVAVGLEDFDIDIGRGLSKGELAWLAELIRRWVEASAGPLANRRSGG